jgi:UDP-N-acetylmuramoylalanine--D-glutamate ligase
LTRVLVLGLGVTGDAVVRHRRAAGDAIVVIDDRPHGDAYRRAAESARSLGAEVVEMPDERRISELVEGAELVVPSPGVAARHAALLAALAGGVPVRAEIDLAAERAAARGRSIVAVTGTNGKTSVTTLLAAMLDASGVHAVAAGNFGTPLLDAAETDAGVIVAEVSSFQLAFTTPAFRPDVAVLLNVAPDHLDWHETLDAYVQAKARVFEHQHGDDLLVSNADDAIVTSLASRAPGRGVTFSLHGRTGYRVEHGALVDPDGQSLLAVSELTAGAPHDVANALAAAAAALDAGASRAGVSDALRAFRRLPHRVEPVAEALGVRFVDDSKATNPHATARAVEAFDAPVVLLAGGRNKGLDLGTLRSLAPRLRAVVAIGEAAGEVEAAFAGAALVRHAVTMREAVRHAVEAAEPGDVVLLSPGCASFDWYPGYAARGDDFAREVAILAPEGVT